MKINLMKNSVAKKGQTIGVVAATGVDTKFGIDLLENKNIPAVGVSISNTPQEQTRLQALNKKELTKIVINSIRLSESKGIDKIMIYCNSLSGAIDLEKVISCSKADIATPIDVYEKIATKHKNFGLLAANGQSIGNIEKRILEKNKNAFIIGYCNIKIVYDVEKGISPKKIIDKHSLGKICNFFAKSGAEIVILGCTHFPYFYDALDSNTCAKLFDPSEKMIQILEKEKLMTSKIPNFYY
ncbi:MAG: Glutamate racemase [Candidatus Woesearchaeota archaeon]|nr:Glutamate racemase [Candidatus Woesearchaeota archaeon]